MRRYFLPMMLGSILIGAGIVLSIFEFSFFSYVDHLPEHDFEEKSEVIYYTIDNKDLYIRVWNDNYHIVKDETLVNQAKVTFNYYSNFISLTREETERNNYRQVRARFDIAHNNEDFYKKLFELIALDLQNKKIHNYLPFFRPYIEINVNPNEIDKIKILKR